MIIIAMVLLVSLIIAGRDGVILGTFQTLIGALIRATVKK
jgi:hypothetical protein